MTEAEKILQMIENADPENTEALDEIDARFSCWFYGSTFHRMVPFNEPFHIKFMSSRPEGRHVTMLITQSIEKTKSRHSRILPTEYLAELYVIISAIEYERTNKEQKETQELIADDSRGAGEVLEE